MKLLGCQRPSRSGPYMAQYDDESASPEDSQEMYFFAKERNRNRRTRTSVWSRRSFARINAGGWPWL